MAMKKTTFIFCLLLASLSGLFIKSAKAQVSTYAFAQNAGTYVPITGGRVLVSVPVNTLSGNNPFATNVYLLPSGSIPFSFQFNGVTYTTGCVSPQGYFTFGNKVPHFYFERDANQKNYESTRPLSSTSDTGYDGAISALAAQGSSQGGTLLPGLMGGANAGQQGEIRYQTLGVAPARTFVVQYKNAYLPPDGNQLLNFQIQLHETTNVIDIVYGSCAGGRAATVEVGLRGYDPSDFLNRTGSAWASSTAGTANTATLPLGTGVGPPTGLTYTFTPAAPAPCPQPFSVVARVRTATTAMLGWRTRSGPGPYQVEWGPAGYAPGTAAALGSLSTPTATATLTGLTPYTPYDAYVTQACGGAAGSSPRSAKGSFRTKVVGDDPVDAIDLPITAICQPVNATTVNATETDSLTAPGYDRRRSCNSNVLFDVRADLWFKFTTVATGPAATAVRLEASGQPACRLRVFASASGGPAGPFTSIYCTVSTTIQAFLPVILAPLQPNTTYYAVVSPYQYTNTVGPFTLCATVPPACSGPANLASDVRQSTATTAQLTFVPGSGAQTYTATAAPVGGGVPVVLTVPASAGVSPLTLPGLTPATSYNVTLLSDCGPAGQSTPPAVLAGARPVNDRPAGAIALPVGATCQPVTGTTVNALTTPYGLINQPPGTTCGATTASGVWYTFTTPATGPGSRAVRITLAGSTRNTQSIWVMSSAAGAAGPFTLLQCAASIVATPPNPPPPPLDVPNLTPSTLYWVRIVDGSYSSTSIIYTGERFTVCVSEPPTCGDPQGLNVDNVTSTTARLLFAAGTPAAGSYRVVVTPQGGPAWPPLIAAGTSGIIVLTGLAPGTYYDVTLTADCGSGGLSGAQAVAFFTPGTPPNDLCPNAQPLACGQTLNGTTASATAGDAPAGLCAALPVDGPGVWYRLTGTGADVTLTTCGSPSSMQPAGFLKRLHVFGGTCGALVCLGANAQQQYQCAVDPTYTFATVAGTTYYVLVSGVSGATGEFELAATCRPANTCPPPTNAQVTLSAGYTQALATFVPGAPGSYTSVNLDRADGTGITVVNGAIPGRTSVALAVQPGVSYVATFTTLCDPNLPATRGYSVPLRVPFFTGLATRAAALAAQVALYPNPTSARTTLVLPPELRPATAGTATLLNSIGQVVRTVALSAGAASTTFEVRGLPSGAYLLRVPTREGTVSKRLSVE